MRHLLDYIYWIYLLKSIKKNNRNRNTHENDWIKKNHLFTQDVKKNHLHQIFF
jgi:hypothetical protein